MDDTRYAGFWIRVGASLIDMILIALITIPLLLAAYGPAYLEPDAPLVAGPVDVLLSYVLPAVATIAFWLWKRATPGKMAVSTQVVDARTGDTIGALQAVVRYIGYVVAGLPLGLGFLWVAFDGRKQGWHDKLARTVVVQRNAPVRYGRA
ncbi:RDD family protein [Coralloluteibacterium stylophorae]|uniref:RDD family protein n=1 Tax=Coralloluteibacterium stylophorae TaxID=1776034 RepID=A0A8J7VQ74_9GAMM|nr:RDD family protein [Coralloluteibacterium stylophorae]MBS7457351.1 RDD family protein [Coralloluteibacterium stylophorae]